VGVIVTGTGTGAGGIAIVGAADGICANAGAATGGATYVELAAADMGALVALLSCNSPDMNLSCVQKKKNRTIDIVMSIK
jgi:hypothetical protein